MQPSEKNHPAPVVYEYRCTDKSLLTKWISKEIAPRLERIFPASLSANAITVLGTALVLIAGLTASAQASRSPLGWCVAAALLIWAYCLLDHVDGCRARARGTSGPVGEFLDHSLDAANIFIIAYLVLAAGRSGTHAPELDILLNTSCAVVTIATWCEQHSAREIRLPALGPVEGVFAAALFLLTLHVPVLRDFWGRSALGPLTCFDLLILGVTLGMFITSFNIARTTPASRPAVLGLTFSGLLASGLAHFLPALAPLVSLLLVYLTFGFAARIISAHLNHLPLPATPFFALWISLVLATGTLLLLPAAWPWVCAILALITALHAFGLWRRACLSLTGSRPVR